MKNLKEKFRNKIKFVKPLYRKVKPHNNVHTKHTYVCIDIDSGGNQCGNGIDIKSTGKTNAPNINTNETCIERYRVPVSDDRETKSRTIQRENRNVTKLDVRSVNVKSKMLGVAEGIKPHEVIIEEGEISGIAQVKKLKSPDSWLRVYPVPRSPEEGICSLVFRCFMCQLGLTVFLILWTLAWVLIINYFEGPYEKKVSKDFQREQNQLVINLATELRQITPLSPKWRRAIEARLEEERMLTIRAVGRGARLHPGHFWDVAGTFLFTIYVMTALGFGAPVPQTTWGRSASLVYAAVTVPTHIYLMVNLSTCAVIHIEQYVHRLKLLFSGHKDKNSTHSKKSVLHKAKVNNSRRKCMRVLTAICFGRGVPLALVLYYMVGALSFGVARKKQPLEVIMFPLEFTTSGGLEHVEHHIRMLYGVYVEGAMVMLSCALASLRRHNGGAIEKMAAKYQLIVTEADT